MFPLRFPSRSPLLRPSFPARRRWRARSLVALLLGAPGVIRGQQVLGPTADATVLPRGMLRVAIAPTWGRFHERFADGTGRTAEGKKESLAADFARAIGIAQYQPLAAVNASLQSLLAGTGDLPLSLGGVQARFDASVANTPIAIDFGLSKRVMIGAVIPMVKRRTEVSLNPNPGGLTGNVGVNPAFFSNTATRSTNALVVSQLTAALQALQALLQSCTGSTAPSCAAVNADRTGAAALVSATTGAISGIEGVYGVSTAKPGSRLAPVARSPIQLAVEARIAALSTSFKNYLGNPTSGSAWIADKPVGAPPLAYVDFQRILVDSSFGVRADSLVSVETSAIGDIEIGGKILLLDSFGATPAQRARLGGLRYRLAVGGAYRFATGLRDSVDQFAAIGGSDGQPDIEWRAFLDLLFGRRLWASVAARYIVQRADSITERVPNAPHEPLRLWARRTVVTRDLGDVLALEVSPRYVLSRNMGLSATWQYLDKGADTYRVPGTATATSLDVSPLAAGTARREQRALLSFTYSTLAQYYERRARTPIEVSLTVGRSLSGNGNAPVQSITALSVRVYNQLF